MSKKDAFLQFLKAARSLQDRGLSKEAILQFAKNEFGELSELFKKQIDNLFKPKKGIENIKIKDEVFDDTVIKLPIDDTGVPFNPNDPLKQYGKPKKEEGIKTIEGQMEKINKASSRLDELIKEREAMFKPKKTDDEIVQDLVDEKFGKGYFDTVKDPPIGFQTEKFIKDFPVTRKEAERIAKLPNDERKIILQKYIDEDMSRQITLMDYDPPKDRKPNAAGGRAGFSGGGGFQMDLPFGEPMFTMKMNGKLFGIYKNKDGSHLSVPLGSDNKPNYAKGGRAGYYGGGQAMVEPDLSDIGHGSDALMGRTRLTAPGSQATTSTGLNYLLGEDNDNVRVPFNNGLLVPPVKPYTEDMFEDESMTLLKGMYGTGPESNKFLYNEMIKKGNKLREQGVERETVIEIIRNNKDKINAFLETQTGDKKSLAGLADGGRIGYATKGKVDLADLEALKGLKKARSENEGGIRDLRSPMLGQSVARTQRNKILDKAIAKFTYAVDNLDQETSSYVKSLFNEKLKIGYETTMSGLKQDAFAKTGVVPIDKETIYNAIINLDLPKELKLEMEASGNTAGSEELAFSLSNNKLGITYDNQSQTIVGKYNFDSKDGKLSITPSIQKNEDSQIQSKIEINKAIEGGKIDLDVEKDTTDNSLTTDFSFVKDGNVLSAKNVSGTDNNYMEAEGIADVPLYMLKDGEKPYISSEYYKDNNYDSLTSSIGLPITNNLEASLSNVSGDGMNTNKLGIDYRKYIDNIFTKNKTKNNRGIFSSSFNIDDQGKKNAMFEIKFPLGGNTTDNIGNMNFENAFLSRDEKERLERERLENTMYYNGKAYQKNNIYSGNELSGLIEGTKDNFNLSNLIGPVQELASGGIADLRQGYSKGKGVDLARRGFLKVLGATAAGVAAFKSGVLKVLGKTSTTKSIPKIVEIGKDAGTPAWFEPMVNKVLADGLDVTKKNAYVDGQTVKRLDTPNGKVDVYHNERTGEIDVDYIGSGTALDEGVQMNYKPGMSMADEVNPRPADEFMATENIPEGQVVGPDDYEIGLGENTVGDVKNLYSDTSELAELGGEKLLIKDISESIKKKKTLNKMKENPSDFVTDVQGDYDPT